jgi:periplasmic divalent cation tolerance protein
MSGEMIVLVTCPPQEADRLACDLVEEKLAACVNVIPAVSSTYRWEGKVTQDSESLLIIKSHKAFWQRLEIRIKELHSYEVPEMLCFPIDGGHIPYLNWLNGQLEGAFR